MGLISIFWIGAQVALGKLVKDAVKFRMNFADLSSWSPGKAVITDGLHYMTHFACNIGICKYELKVRVVDPQRYLERALKAKNEYVYDEDRFGDWSEAASRIHEAKASSPLTFRAILDEEWEDKGLSKSYFTPRRAGKECMGDIESRLLRTIQLPINGEWSDTLKGSLSQTHRPHHWYFVLEDCGGSFIRKFTQEFGINPRVLLPNIQIQYELTIFNVNGSHMGTEFKNMRLITMLGFLICLGSFGIFVWRQFDMKKNRIHPLSQCINICLLSTALSLLFNYINISVLKNDGIGMPVLDGFGFLIRCTSSLVLVATMFAVALGYSLQVPGMTIPGEAVIAGSLCYSFVELILRFAQFKNYSFRYHFHQNQGAIPILIGFFRMCISILFWLSCYGTLSRDDLPHQEAIKEFLRKFRWRGVLMLMGNSLVVLFITFTHRAYNQQRWIEILSLVVEVGSVVYLGFAFLTTKTSYFKASEMGSSILPVEGLGAMPSRQNRHRLD